MSAYFSIILPIYNVAPYLERCLHSILAQKFCDYEIILVDDGSTDQSPAICDDYAARYERIRVIHKENGGLSSARNAGFDVAQGQYIWWVDSDDWIEGDALLLLHRAIEKNRPDMVKFNYIRVEAQRQMLARSNAEPGLYSTKEAVEKNLLELAFFTPGTFCLSAWSYVYSREFLNRNGLRFVSERVIGSEDYLFNLQALLAAEKVRVLEDALYSYELRMGSLTQCYKKGLPEKYTQLYLRLREHCAKMEALKVYEGRIDRFYIWHLLRGTCIPNEYYVTNEHSLADGRRNIRTFFAADLVQEAIKRCDRSRLSRKHRVQLWAMRKQREELFYWLYVVKPNLKKRNNE